MNMPREEIEQKILIALNSTAAFSPKMLFGAEPTVILLYRLMKTSEEVRRKRDQQYENLATIYTDRSKVIIPETEEELKTALTALRSPQEREPAAVR